MTAINITKDVQALNKLKEVSRLLYEGTTYYFVNGDSPVHEDDWDDYGDVDDFWSYTFAAEDEQVLLDYYLGLGNKQATDNVCQLLHMGGTKSQSFHHALYMVLSEFC